MTSRGIRNNNPLNIRRSADRWEGARARQTDRSFVQFESMAFGYRAAWKILERYWQHFKEQRQPFTVGNIIARWAPPSENDTEAYVRTVLRLTSLGGNEHLPRPFMGYMLDKLARLLAAMTVMECGIAYDEVDQDAIWHGYDLAFPGKRKVKQRRLAPQTPADAGTVSLPKIDGTTLRDWDEYWDW